MSVWTGHRNIQREAVFSDQSLHAVVMHPGTIKFLGSVFLEQTNYNVKNALMHQLISEKKKPTKKNWFSVAVNNVTRDKQIAQFRMLLNYWFKKSPGAPSNRNFYHVKNHNWYLCQLYYICNWLFYIMIL